MGSAEVIGAAGGVGVVPHPPQALVLPSPLHQVFDPFRPAATVTFSNSKVDKRAIMLYHSICQLLQKTS